MSRCPSIPAVSACWQGTTSRVPADWGARLVAIGLFYSQGYFRQHLNKDGWQEEQYLATQVENLPMEPALSPDGHPVSIEIATRSGACTPRCGRCTSAG